MLATVYANRWLLASFLRRELSTRYAGSATGAAWAILHPLALLAVYGFVFSLVFRVRLPADAGGASYTAFAAVALWPWIMFSEGIVRGMAAVHENASLVRKVAFPHALVVYAAVGSSFLVHLAGYAVVLAALAALGEPLHLARLPFVLFLLAPLLLVATGVAVVLAALQTLLKDVEQVVSILLMVVFYGTPILYPLSFVPAPFGDWMAWSPLASLAERLRDVLIAGQGLAWTDAGYWAIGIATWWAGQAFFERVSPHFEDFL
ncbi:MAG: phosphate ABC transporter permease [Betaproteobacteria bacterium]|nr:phosphate ABC transporter permease [Betaproteobacteria bacterium]PWB64681.1 MAG: phosphate ABC transporter permease [Betaproteobacteria bacterium]